MDREKIDYTIAVSQIQELAKIDAHYMPLLANVSALLNDMLSDVNWVGFYIMKNDQLVLGPFQGKPFRTGYSDVQPVHRCKRL